MNQPDNQEKQGVPAPATKKTWLKRIGVAGFLFFLIKGIVWLFIFYGGFRLSGC